jgi:hypothetical protein
MSLRSEIQAEIAELQRKLAILNGAPSDTFSFGTVVVFATPPPNAQKWYYFKTAEETWTNAAGH